MYLVFGSPHDPCCTGVLASLQTSGRYARIIENPFAHPARCSWRLDGPTPSSEWAFGDESAEDIEGVLVRSGAWIDPTGWQPDDFAYVHAETHAALLAWLTSLPCPVINRPVAASWYRPQVPLVAWRPALRRAGLDTPTTLITNSGPSIRTFRDRLAGDGAAGAVYAPLTSEARYLVSTDAEWSGLAAFAERAPISLTYPHGDPVLACVIGQTVVWNGDPPADARALEQPLTRFAREASLQCVEIAMAPTTEGPRVVEVEPQPRTDHFSPDAQQLIVAALTRALTSAPAVPVSGPPAEVHP